MPAYWTQPKGIPVKLFLDTNVMVDVLLDDREPFRQAAEELFFRIGAGRIEACLSTSQATDLYYLLRKGAGDEAARKGIRMLFSLCELIPTPVSACMSALGSSMNDYEDAVQAETARAAGCDFIVTRNLNDYESSPVPAIDPASLLAILAAE